MPFIEGMRMVGRGLSGHAEREQVARKVSSVDKEISNEPLATHSHCSTELEQNLSRLLATKHGGL